MQTEPTEKETRIWLSRQEQERILNYYDEDLGKQLAVRLGLLGLRVSEIVNVSREDIRRLNAEEEAYKLKIEVSKTGYRETPLPVETKKTIQMLAKAKEKGKSEPVIDASKRTVQRWVKTAARDLSNETGVEEWQEVSAHDLRRSWCTYTYWNLGGTDHAKDVLMRWGGWTDEQTFQANYLGREPDDLAAQLMEKANLC